MIIMIIIIIILTYHYYYIIIIIIIMILTVIIIWIYPDPLRCYDPDVLMTSWLLTNHYAIPPGLHNHRPEQRWNHLQG